MIQLRDGASFALEAGLQVEVGSDRRMEGFDGDNAIEPDVASAVDFSHTAGANGREDFVRAEMRAGGKTHVATATWSRVVRQLYFRAGERLGIVAVQSATPGSLLGYARSLSEVPGEMRL